MKQQSSLDLDLKTLRESQRVGRFAEFLRKPKKYESATGYLLEESPDCVLIELLNWDCFRWNGKCIIWKHTLKSVHSFEGSEWPTIAGKKLEIMHRVEVKNVSGPVENFLKRHFRNDDIILVEQEGVWPNELFLCKILAINRNGLRVKSYDRTLRNADEIAIPYRSITKITFGDGYSIAASAALKSMLALGVSTPTA
jgi:hypothetical protein